MKYGFPHDELKPISKTYTNSFAELGNLELTHLPRAETYNGIALTVIDSLSTLAVLNDTANFTEAVMYVHNSV